MPSKAAGPRIFLSDWIWSATAGDIDVGYFPPNTPRHNSTAHSTALMLWGLGIMTVAILIMLAEVVIVSVVGWHGRGRWY